MHFRILDLIIAPTYTICIVILKDTSFLIECNNH